MFCFLPLFDLNQAVSLFQDGHIALHLAVRRCQVEVVKTLISQGCFVDFQDRHGNTPLHVACKDGNVPIVMALCEANCSLDVPNKVNGIWMLNYIIYLLTVALGDLFKFSDMKKVFSLILLSQSGQMQSIKDSPHIFTKVSKFSRLPAQKKL